MKPVEKLTIVNEIIAKLMFGPAKPAEAKDLKILAKHFLRKPSTKAPSRAVQEALKRLVKRCAKRLGVKVTISRDTVKPIYKELRRRIAVDSVDPGKDVKKAVAGEVIRTLLKKTARIRIPISVADCQALKEAIFGEDVLNTASDDKMKSILTKIMKQKKVLVSEGDKEQILTEPPQVLRIVKDKIFGADVSPDEKLRDKIKQVELEKNQVAVSEDRIKQLKTEIEELQKQKQEVKKSNVEDVAQKFHKVNSDPEFAKVNPTLKLHMKFFFDHVKRTPPHLPLPLEALQALHVITICLIDFHDFPPILNGEHPHRRVLEILSFHIRKQVQGS